MPFSIRPHSRFPVQCAVTYNVEPFLKLSLAYFLGFGSAKPQAKRGRRHEANLFLKAVLVLLTPLGVTAISLNESTDPTRRAGHALFDGNQAGLSSET